MDKSISHRALIIGAMADGETRISGLLEAEDVLNTAKAMRSLGATLDREAPGTWNVRGVGVGRFTEPKVPLDFGNSGTGSRLVMGAVATTNIKVTFIGDESLERRPMARVLDPLTLFGARYAARERGLMPIVLEGARGPVPIDYAVTVASAQVKSALLLAGLNAPGRSHIVQHVLTRDHTERMLEAFGADIVVTPLADGGEAFSITGPAELKGIEIDVPRDPSSAAFPLAAAILVPGSQITIPGVLLNARRTGLIDTLIEMGADIAVENVREDGGESVGDLVVRASKLSGIHVPAARAPSMIDEYPILSVLAAFADGRTEMRGLEELRVKESDRLSAIADGLKACGVHVEELADGLIIEGCGAHGVPGGATIATHMDHRIAMSFMIAGLAAKNPIGIDDASMIATSFPEFENLMRGLGAEFGPT